MDIQRVQFKSHYGSRPQKLYHIWLLDLYFHVGTLTGLSGTHWQKYSAPSICDIPSVVRPLQREGCVAHLNTHVALAPNAPRGFTLCANIEVRPKHSKGHGLGDL